MCKHSSRYLGYKRSKNELFPHVWYFSFKLAFALIFHWSVARRKKWLHFDFGLEKRFTESASFAFECFYSRSRFTVNCFSFIRETIESFANLPPPLLHNFFLFQWNRSRKSRHFSSLSIRFVIQSERRVIRWFQQFLWFNQFSSWSSWQSNFLHDVTFEYHEKKMTTRSSILTAN